MEGEGRGDWREDNEPQVLLTLSPGLSHTADSHNALIISKSSIIKSSIYNELQMVLHLTERS